MQRALSAGMSITLAAAVAACGADRGASPGPTGTAGRPNVVLVLVDTLRPDHLGFYGYDQATAPFLSGIADRSSVFLEAVSTSSWTAPSTASVHSGLYPTEHGVIEGFRAHRRRAARESDDGEDAKISLNRLPPEVPTLAERLHGLGYSTFGLATNVNIGPEIGFDRGFDHFEHLKPRKVPARRTSEWIGSRRIESIPADEVIDRLLEWETEIRASDPYFVYLHLNDVHSPYHKRAPWYADDGGPMARKVSAYDSEIHHVDAMLGRLYQRFQLDQDTLFVVVSDHGEAFGEHGQHGHSALSLYGMVNRVLLLIHGPGLGLASGERRERVSLVDVLPTVLDLTGGDAADAPATSGLSLAPVLRPNADRESRQALLRALERRALFAHRYESRPVRDGHAWAIFRGPWKLIETPDGIELFDMRTDPKELHDLAESQPDVLAGLTHGLRDFQSQAVSSDKNRIDVPLDQETIDALRALGYVQ